MLRWLHILFIDAVIVSAVIAGSNLKSVHVECQMYRDCESCVKDSNQCVWIYGQFDSRRGTAGAKTINQNIVAEINKVMGPSTLDHLEYPCVGGWMVEKMLNEYYNSKMRPKVTDNKETPGVGYWNILFNGELAEVAPKAMKKKKWFQTLLENDTNAASSVKTYPTKKIQIHSTSVRSVVDMCQKAEQPNKTDNFGSFRGSGPSPRPVDFARNWKDTQSTGSVPTGGFDFAARKNAGTPSSRSGTGEGGFNFGAQNAGSRSSAGESTGGFNFATARSRGGKAE